MGRDAQDRHSRATKAAGRPPPPGAERQGEGRGDPCRRSGRHPRPASVYLGAFARVRALKHQDVAAALYDERSVLKILGMRRTMFVVPRDVAAIVNSAVTRAIGVAERKRLIQMLELELT